MSDLLRAEELDSNLIFNWRWFTDPGLRGRYAPEQHDALGHEYVADLRVASGRRPDDADVRHLVDALTSPARWSRLIVRATVTCVTPRRRARSMTRASPVVSMRSAIIST